MSLLLLMCALAHLAVVAVAAWRVRRALEEFKPKHRNQTKPNQTKP